MRKRFAILGLACALAAAAGGVEILPEDAPFDLQDLQRAEITLKLARASPLLPGLPALVEISVSNPTAAALVLPLPTLSKFYNPGNTLDLLFARGAADTPPTRIEYVQPYFGPLKEGLRPAPARLMSLRPGEVWSAQVPVSYDWIVGKPSPVLSAGPVRLWAKLCAVQRDGKGLWRVQRNTAKTSNALSLPIQQPSGPDAPAYADLMRLEHPWLLAAPEAAEHILQGADFEALRKLADRHANSVYALYGKAALARMYAFGDRLEVHPTRAPDLATGFRLANEVLRDPRFVLHEPEARFQLRLQAQLRERKK